MATAFADVGSRSRLVQHFAAEDVADHQDVIADFHSLGHPAIEKRMGRE